MRYRVLLLAALVLAPSANAQRGGADSAAAQRWDVTLARGKTRDIDFTTSEGTWMSTDISADGRWIYFDLLGHVYRVSSAGGDAACLTQSSGVALNYQPRVSPDGRTVAFISDRRGQNNLWIMNADGSNPRPVFTDLTQAAAEPAWTPDGQFIIVRRGARGGGDGPPPPAGLVMYHKDGGSGQQLVAGGVWPSPSKDGRYLYYHVSMPSVTGREMVAGALQLRRFSFRDGEVLDITNGESVGAAAGRFSSGGGAAPEISPDGRWLAFARHIPDGTITYKGHTYGPRTALWLRDVRTGAERMLMDPIDPLVSSAGKTLGVLPRYKWAADGRSIVIAQGGKLRRIDAASGVVSTIPFTANVHRTISEMARREFRITDEPVKAQFVRWPSATADGATIAFQALGRVYVQGKNGSPRRLTSASFTPLEYAPTWSPDGKWIAFVTFDDSARGGLWKVSGAGGVPVRLSREPGDFVDPVWSPDGRSVVVARGEGATARGRTLTHNGWFDLVRYSAATADTGEVITTVVRPTGLSVGGEARRQLLRPSFGPDGRLFFPDQRASTPAAGGAPGGRGGTALASVRADGSNRQTHLTFPAADEIVPSPDGRYVAFQEGDNVYVTPFSWGGIGTDAQRIDKRRGIFPVTQLSRDGGIFPRWRDGHTLEWGSGNKFFVYNVDTKATDTTTLSVSAPRDVPTGTVAITGARIVTLNARKVIENGTIIVRGSRIACVGTSAECSTSGANRTIDANGKTIIPGFVDMHAHHYREWRGMRPPHDFEQAIYLAYGVTTTMDVSTWSQNVFPTAELIETGAMIGPRTFSTGDNASAGDGARTNEITNLAGGLALGRRMSEWGATQIKQYAQPRRDQRQWVTEAGRQSGLNVTSEGSNFIEDIAMIMDGQTGWEHPFSEVPMYSDGAKFLGAAKATYSPTLVVAGPQAWNIEYWFGSQDWWKDAKQRRWFPWRALIPQLRTRTLRPESDYSFPLIAQAMADIIAEGGYGALGSHGEQHGLAPHWEVWMGASALGAHGALEVASLHGAKFLGADRDLGSLEVGKLADLMVLNTNPLDNIKNTMDIKFVMKGGKLYDGMTLDEIWPKAVPFGPAYWVNADALQMNTKPTTAYDKPAP